MHDYFTDHDFLPANSSQYLSEQCDLKKVRTLAIYQISVNNVLAVKLISLEITRIVMRFLKVS